jgi:hypothetical protein
MTASEYEMIEYREELKMMMKIFSKYLVLREEQIPEDEGNYANKMIDRIKIAMSFSSKEDAARYVQRGF